MKIKMTLDSKTKTILFWRKSQGSSPINMLDETDEAVYRGELPHNFRHGNCEDFFYEKKSNQIKPWHDQNDDYDRCQLMKHKCRSMFELHQRITNARMKAVDKIGYYDVFSRTLSESNAFLAATNPKIEDYPFLQLTAEDAGSDPTSVAKGIVLQGAEYDSLLIQTERLRLKWYNSVKAAESIEDVTKITQTMMASTLLD